MMKPLRLARALTAPILLVGLAPTLISSAHAAPFNYNGGTNSCATSYFEIDQASQTGHADFYATIDSNQGNMTGVHGTVAWTNTSGSGRSGHIPIDATVSPAGLFWEDGWDDVATGTGSVNVTLSGYITLSKGGSCNIPTVNTSGLIS
jgi:hypothetical protein